MSKRNMIVRRPDRLETYLFFLSLIQAVCLSVCALQTLLDVFFWLFPQADIHAAYSFLGPVFLLFAAPHILLLFSRCLFLPYLLAAGTLALLVFCAVRGVRRGSRLPAWWLCCLAFFLIWTLLGMVSLESAFHAAMGI